MTKPKVKFVTPEGRVCFPHIFTPNAFQGQTPKYSVQILLPKGNQKVEAFIAELKQAVISAVNEKWPNVETRPTRPNLSLKDGDTWTFEDGRLKKDTYPEIIGHWVVLANSIQKPTAVDQNVKPIMNDHDLYAGCWARISFNVFAYDKVKKGVGFGLQNIQKIRDDDSFAGRSRAEDDFEPVGDPLNEQGTPGTAPAGVEVSNHDSMFS